MNRYKIISLLLMLNIFNLAYADDSRCILKDGINIETNNKRLLICEENKIVKEFRIAIGKNGVGKTHEGDKKTPLGLYAIGSPRKSHYFGTFIPIQYPTQEQMRAGFTGTNVGIHGPIQDYSWLGPLNTLFNWTYGCVAVARNNQIEYIANWVDTHPNGKVFIR